MSRGRRYDTEPKLNMKKDFPDRLRRKDDMNIEYHAIKGFKLRMY